MYNPNFNPNPGTKMAVLLMLSTAMIHFKAMWSELVIVGIISLFFMLNGRIATGIKGFLFYLFLFFVFSNATVDEMVFQMPVALKIVITLLMTIKIFYLTVYPAQFFLATSDVGSMIAVMDQIKAPKAISIPIAVMFRFFPAFSEERKNIKFAMKMRGITPLNPIRYFEYVTVPLLISSSNITDDIAKSAETKCIAHPCKKTRYQEIRIGVADYVYFFGILIVLILGILTR